MSNAKKTAKVVRLFLGPDDLKNGYGTELIEGRISLAADVDFIDEVMKRVVMFLREMAFNRHEALMAGHSNKTLNEGMMVCAERLVKLSMLKARRIALTKKG